MPKNNKNKGGDGITLCQVIERLWKQNKEQKRKGWVPFGSLCVGNTIERLPKSDNFTFLYGKHGFWEAVRDAKKKVGYENIWIEFGHRNGETNKEAIIQQLTCVIKGQIYKDPDGWVEAKTWEQWDEEIKMGGKQERNKFGEYFGKQVGISLPIKFVRENCKGCERFRCMHISNGDFQAVWCREPREECRRAVPEWLEELED